MKATTLQPLTVNVGSHVHNPSGFAALVIPAGECVCVEQNGASLSSNVWIRWGVHRGKVECGEPSRLVERGQIEWRAN